MKTKVDNISQIRSQKLLIDGLPWLVMCEQWTGRAVVPAPRSERKCTVRGACRLSRSPPGRASRSGQRLATARAEAMAPDHVNSRAEEEDLRRVI